MGDEVVAVACRTATHPNYTCWEMEMLLSNRFCVVDIRHQLRTIQISFRTSNHGHSRKEGVSDPCVLSAQQQQSEAGVHGRSATTTARNKAQHSATTNASSFGHVLSCRAQESHRGIDFSLTHHSSFMSASPGAGGGPYASPLRINHGLGERV